MFTEERQQKILESLRESGKVRVRDLSERFGVTDDCIRKDLKTLENAGSLKRIYGGALLSRDYTLNREVVQRRTVHTEEKKIIAAKAAALIRPGETLFLDVSTTNVLIAQNLAASGIKVRVVTNMIDILEELVKSPSITPIATGGRMHTSVNGFIGIEAAAAIRSYSFDQGFFGCCGIDATDSDYSLTTLGAEDGLTKRAALKASRHKYVLMEHQKFDSNECYKYAKMDDIDAVITDEEPNPEIRELIESVGVDII